MNTVTSVDSSYYAANTNEKTEKGPCLAMTPYGVIGVERVNALVNQKQVGCFNHRVVALHGCRQTGETVVVRGLL